ncbi:E3 ubiquitin-protein ligase rnf213-alpha-like [Saccostrea cucullata]|uniref:E3 ubiquitin-protein ligase rnf213-alpha-like n=1 Tax=Saccostrea cuccullata TaxID=36930 RepID=UPI002ED60052
MRQKEVDRIEKIRKDMQTIVKIGEILQVDTRDLQKHLRKISSIEEKRIAELCILPSGSQSHQDQYIPVIVGEETIQGMLDIIPTFQRLSENTVFLQILTDEESKEIKDEFSNKTCELIIKNVWQNAESKWKRLCNEMKSGNIKFKTFEKYFKGMNTEEVRTVLKMMSDKDVGWIDQRINQYRDLKLMTQCSKAAILILKIVQEYDLKGDFSPIRSLTEMGHIGENSLKSIDKSKLEVCKVLHGITEENVECLQAFIESKPLIKWLNENLKEDELKVFVDLATIAAGEGDIEVAKVKCLQSATAGYAPLIFILKKPCDSKLFLGKCKQVWKECETDKALPRKLRDTCNHLEWIENVKSATGSVEVTSLKLAENINQHGFYIIGGLKTLSSRTKLVFQTN